MKKNLILIVLSLSILFTTNTLASDKISWIDYNSEKGLFTVMLPNEPKVTSITREEYTAHSVLSKTNSVQYKIVYSVHNNQLSPSDKILFIDNAKSIFVNTKKSKIKAEKDITIGNNRGKEIKLITQQKQCIYYRIFFNNNILYTLYVLSDKKFAPKKEKVKFFDSFKLTGGHVRTLDKKVKIK